MKPPVLFIVGPTASGKSALALALARRLNGEIISADSMQVYKGMNIGTAKPTPAEQKAVPHHLIDILSASRTFSVFEYRRLALKKIREILERGRLPIVTGGSGLYLRSLLQGLSDYKEKPLSELGFEPMVYGIRKDREQLYRDIEKRVDKMFAGGWISEVKRLARRRISKTAAKALGYREISEALKNKKRKMDIPRLKALIKKNTRHFAKRQLTWFRKEPGIHWIEWKEAHAAR